MVRPRDGDLPDLERLAQRIEHLRLELGQLVEEEYAVMGERDFARPRAQSAADQRRHAGGMMRRAERTAIGERAALDLARDRGDHRDFEQFRRRQRRQDGRQPRGQHRLAGAGRSDHEQIVTAGGGDFERALGALLALDVLEVGERAVDLADLRLRTGEHLRAAEMIGELNEGRGGDDLHFRARPGGFGENRAEVGGGFMDFARSRVAIGAVALASLWLLAWPEGPGVPTSSAQEAKSSPHIWTVPEMGALPNNAHGRLVRRGRDLITATYAHIGPEVADPAKRFAGNNLACGNCHLQAGTKKFGIPLFGLFGAFPHYSARLGAQMTIEERLNACMTRSMNGRPLPAGAPEMQALVAYIKFLSTGVAPGQLLPGMGTGNMPELDRAADPARGAASYASTCVACHGPNGAGIRRSLPTTDLGYMMPPLWGSDSFNDGAGMARLITAANFLHFNMPHGVDYLNPQLSPEQSWDIAAYVLSQPRPHKAGLDKDFPDLLEKPVDAPYGPYADGFSEQQHKYGPFAPIRAAIAKLKAEKAGGPSPASR